MGASSSLSSASSTSSAAPNNNALAILGSRLGRVESFLRENNINLNLTQAYQQIGLLYNSFKNDLEQTRQDLDAQIADFEQLRAYVNSLVLKAVPPEIMAEFDRLSKFIKALFDADHLTQERIERTRPVLAFGSMATDEQSVKQLAGTVYTLNSELYVSDPGDVEISGGAIVIKIAGTYRVELVATLFSTGGGADTNGFSDVGLYLNGTLVKKRLAGSYWGFADAKIISVIVVSSVPSRVTAGCAGTWRINEQRCAQASMLVERIFDAPIPRLA